MEILVVNDGSTDATSAISHSYRKRYPGIVRVIDKENGGYGSVINCGIREAKGRYLRLLDGDDWICTENLEGLLTLLEETDCDLILCNYQIYDEVGGTTTLVRACPPDRSLEPGRRYPYSAIGDIRPSMHGQIFRTELFREHGITMDEHCFYTDTEYVSYPVPYLTSFCYYDKPIYVYRLGREGQSVSAKGWNAHERDHERVIAGLLGEYRGYCGSRKDENWRAKYLAQGLALELEKRFQGYPLMIRKSERDYRKRLIALDRAVLGEFPEIGGYRVAFPIGILRKLHYPAWMMVCYYALYGAYKKMKAKRKELTRDVLEKERGQHIESS